MAKKTSQKVFAHLFLDKPEDLTEEYVRLLKRTLGKQGGDLLTFKLSTPYINFYNKHVLYLATARKLV